MESKTVKQAVVSTKTTLDSNQVIEEIALFNADGTVNTGRDAAFGAVTVAGLIGTAGKTSTSAEPAANTLVPMVFTSGNSANSATVAFDGGTARAIKLGGTAATGAKFTLAAGGVALCWFDGTDLHLIGEYV